MASEYEALVTALKATGIPFVEYGWKNRPDTAFGIVSLEMEADSIAGDGEKIDRSWQASVDLYLSRLSERRTETGTVEGVLRSICGSSWWLNSIQFENETGLFHYEWVCELQDSAEAGEANAV